MQNARLSGARFALVAAAVALAVPAVASAQTVFLNVAGESITNSSAQTTARAASTRCSSRAGRPRASPPPTACG